jgi:hypothetical protein
MLVEILSAIEPAPINWQHCELLLAVARLSTEALHVN